MSIGENISYTFIHEDCNLRARQRVSRGGGYCSPTWDQPLSALQQRYAPLPADASNDKAIARES